MDFILRWLDKLFPVVIFNEREVRKKYEDAFVLVVNARTLSDLFKSRKMIDELEELARHTKLNWMMHKNSQLKKLWIRKYKLWKSRG